MAHDLCARSALWFPSGVCHRVHVCVCHRPPRRRDPSAAHGSSVLRRTRRRPRATPARTHTQQRRGWGAAAKHKHGLVQGVQVAGRGGASGANSRTPSIDQHGAYRALETPPSRRRTVHRPTGTPRPNPRRAAESDTRSKRLGQDSRRRPRATPARVRSNVGAGVLLRFTSTAREARRERKRSLGSGGRVGRS